MSYKKTMGNGKVFFKYVEILKLIHTDSQTLINITKEKLSNNY